MTRDGMRYLGIPEDALDAALDAWTREFTAAVALAAQAIRFAAPGAPDGYAGPAQAAAGRLTPAICARRANCDRKTITRAINAGAIRATKGSTGLVFIERRSFEAWMHTRAPDFPALPDMPTRAATLPALNVHAAASARP